jgi:hypothetical protein
LRLELQISQRLDLCGKQLRDLHSVTILGVKFNNKYRLPPFYMTDAGGGLACVSSGDYDYLKVLVESSTRSIFPA